MSEKLRIKVRPGDRLEKGYRYLYRSKEEERVRNAYQNALYNADVIERLGNWLIGNDLRVPDDIREIVTSAYWRLNSRIAEKLDSPSQRVSEVTDDIDVSAAPWDRTRRV